ncbi:leucine-rich repeat and guanylate kinase domain-containing protein isoform X5 [Hydra vulgaris]|uniref:Leucine-rich repeat and guanylate kinase domain-containing protein isoform X5 n=1 Tax=Hydra vulgaris TaxID=6087 RepID=A0ABM4DFW9_HYDVU
MISESVVSKARDYDKLPCTGECDQKEIEERLNDDINVMSDGLFHLGYTADGSSLAFLNLSLKNKNLMDISFLISYVHLQTVDLSHNNISDLSALLSLHYLISLNVSHNKLEKVFNHNGSSAIRIIDCTFNFINEINDLSCHPLLETLLLDFNQIAKIDGLAKCTQLSELSLSHNKIENTFGLEHLKFLTTLDLSNNQITDIMGLENLQKLQHLNMSSNKISSLNGLTGLIMLRKLNLQNNQICDLSQLDYIKQLKMLLYLNFIDNPIQASKNYRLSVLFKIQTLSELDLEAISTEEKVNASNFFKPSKMLLAALDHSYNTMQSYCQDVFLLHSVLSSGLPYPILVLAGQKGLRKKSLARTLYKDYPKCFGLGLTHSTKPIIRRIDKEQPYHYVSEEQFYNKKLKGDFIQTCLIDGYSFGTSLSEIENIAKDHLICILTLSLEGVFGFKYSQFQPRYILLLPDDQKRNSILHDTNLEYSELSLQQSDDYIEFYQNHPGFFDTVIVTDDFNERYRLLKSAVCELFELDFASNAPLGKTLSKEIDCNKTAF